MKNGTTTAKDFAWDAIYTALRTASKTASRHYADVLRLNKIMDADYAAGDKTSDAIVAMRKEALSQMAFYEAQETEFTKILQELEKRATWLVPQCN